MTDHLKELGIRVYGQYCVCRCINHDRSGEMTNVGVSLYSEDGKLLGARADTPDRAVARGDARFGFATKEYILGSLNNYRTLEDLKRHQGNFSYAMSSVQVHNGGATVIEPTTLDDLFDRIVLGIRKPPKVKDPV